MGYKQVGFHRTLTEAQYAELMALYRVALSSAAEKDERLMIEQVLKENLTRASEAVLLYQLIYNVEDVIGRGGG